MSTNSSLSEPKHEGKVSPSAARLIISTLMIPLLGLVSGSLIARSLGPLRRGQYALLIVWNEIGTGVFRFGIPDATAYLDQKGVNRRVLWRSVRLVALVLVPAAAGCGFVVTLLLIRQEAPTWLAVIIGTTVAWSPVLDTIAMVRIRFLVSSSDLNSIAVFNLIQPCGVVLFALSLYLLHNLTLLTASLSVISSQLISYGYLRYKVHQRSAPKDHGSETASILKFGARTVPSSLGEILNSRFDQLIIPTLIGTAQLGIYAISVGVAGLAARVGLALSQSEYAKVGRAEGDILVAAASAIRRSTIACIATALVLSVVSPLLLLKVFGVAYQGAIIPCQILLIGTSLSGANYVASNLANLLGRPGVGSISQVFGLAITIPLIFPAVSEFGLRGAALVSTLVYVARYGSTLVLLRRVGVRGTLPRLNDLRLFIRQMWASLQLRGDSMRRSRQTQL